jgi:asparagine synthase (glutamine-hydrolysing)
VPLLDHRLVELSWAIPTKYKIKDGEAKWPLKQVLHRYLPKELVNRPKMGFGVPIEHWLGGPLREWAEELLNETRLKNEGFFDPKIICQMWKEQKAGRRRRHYYLWDILMFQSWKEEYL